MNHRSLPEGEQSKTEDKLSARIDWGIPPIDSDSEGDSLQEAGIYFQLEYDFFGF